MSDLPAGWRMTTLAEVAESALGKMLDRGKDRGHREVPYLRNINVQWGRVDTHNLMMMQLADDELQRFAVEPGDLLVCEGGEIGRCAIWMGSTDYVGYQKALHRIRPVPEVLDVTYLRYLFEHYAKNGTLQRYSTGSTIAHLPQQKVRRLPVPLPEHDEQRRIVAVIEDHLSRLDAAGGYLAASRRRLDRLRDGLLAAEYAMDAGSATAALPTVEGVDDSALPSIPASWTWRRLGEIADVVGGVTKDAKKQGDPSFVEVPYLRVANVQRGRLDLAAVTTIKVAPTTLEKLRLRQGDVLLNEGGDRDKLGRGWVWEEQIDDCIHQNHVFRARVRDGAIHPELLSLAANTVGGRWCQRNGTQSVNLASISLRKIKLMPVPVPSADEQSAIAERVAERRAACAQLAASLAAAERRQLGLRKALLAAAFSGRLTGRSSDLDVAEELAEA